MEKFEIVKELKEVLRGEDLLKLSQLIQELDQDVLKENWLTSPTDKKKLNAIKRVLTYSEEIRPLLSGFTRFENGVAFTDSYQLYVLNDEYLPFKYACSGSDEDKEYAKKYNLEVVNGVYPNIKNCIPKEYQFTYELDVNSFIAYTKTTPKEGKHQLYSFEVEGTKYTFDCKYMLNLIDILKLNKEKTITLELIGNVNPIIVHNKNNELGLILPVRTY